MSRTCVVIIVLYAAGPTPAACRRSLIPLATLVRTTIRLGRGLFSPTDTWRPSLIRSRHWFVTTVCLVINELGQAHVRDLPLLFCGLAKLGRADYCSILRSRMSSISALLLPVAQTMKT